MPEVGPRLVVLVSGGGTTLQNFIDRIADGRMLASIAGVVSSKPNAMGVERARKAGLPVAIVTRGDSFSERVFDAVRAWKPDLICLAGWLHLLTIPSNYTNRVINIHPSLLPAFGGHGMYGHRVHEAVIASGATQSGCTVHFADNTYDTGPIIAQAAVPVQASDTQSSLAAKVFEAECELYPDAIHRVWNGLHNRNV